MNTTRENLGLSPLEYVGSTEVSGKIQMELLKKEGLIKSSSVLEIGCGCLNLGILLIEYLDKNNYVGIDPNEWLRTDSILTNQKIISNKSPVFISREDFNSSELKRDFDFIFSHSVLSHTADWQLDLFLENSKKALNKGGKILSSIRLAEGNSFGSEGSINRKDSNDEQWQYPGVSWFTMNTLNNKAAKFGLSVINIPEYTEFYVDKRPGECHDWLLFTLK